MISINSCFLLIGGIIFLGIAGSFVFDKTRIPDVLILMGFGVLMGPVFHLVDPDTLRAISPYFGTFALVIILLEGGMGLDFRLLLSQFGPATLLTTATFLCTALALTVLGHISLELPWLVSGILAVILSAAPSPSIVVPIAARLKVPEKTKTLIIVESGLADVLAVVVVIALMNVVSSDTSSQILGQTLIRLFQAFVIAGSVAVAVGLGWLKLLTRFRGHPLSYMMTLGITLLLYSFVEHVGGSGAISALIFGVVLTNAEQLFTRFELGHHFTHDKRLSEFHAEISFFIRTFFFVYVGWVAAFRTMDLRYAAYIVAVCLLVYLIRLVVVSTFTVIYPQERPYRSLYTLMVPRGLTVAVLAGLPGLAAMPGGTHFVDYALVLILVSNLVITGTLSVVEKRITGPEVAAELPPVEPLPLPPIG